MKIKDAIKQLKALNPEDDIVFAYWERDMFEDMKQEDWEDFCCRADDMDWSQCHDSINMQCAD